MKHQITVGRHTVEVEVSPEDVVGTPKDQEWLLKKKVNDQLAIQLHDELLGQPKTDAAQADAEALELMRKLRRQSGRGRTGDGDLSSLIGQRERRRHHNKYPRNGH
jgi:hypothetical protein